LAERLPNAYIRMWGGDGGPAPEGVTYFIFFYLILINLVSRQIPEHFVCCNQFITSRDIAYMRKREGLPPELATYFKFILPNTHHLS